MPAQRQIGLLDIAPDYAIVNIGKGREIRVHGITIEAACLLAIRFPILMQVFSRTGLTSDVILKEAPTSISAIIASACGNPDDQQAEDNARHLPLSAQIAILKATAELTFAQEGGFGPFVDTMTNLIRLFGVQAGKDPDTGSPSPAPRSNGQDTQSQMSAA